MSYNTELQANNADLQKILEKVNALPNADSSGGLVLPDLVNPASPQDMTAGKTLYDDDGNPVTGELYEVLADNFAMVPYETLYGNPGDTVFSVGAVFQKNVEDGDGAIIRKGAILCPRDIPTKDFGNALPEQVAKGATFTSAAGLLVEGTHECDPGLQLTPLANPAGSADIVKGKALYDADGNLVVGTLDPDTGGVQMHVEGETLYITGDVAVENETLIL